MSQSYQEGYYDTIGFDRIHYQKMGEGEGVVLIHGMPTWSYLWRDVMPILAGHYSVYAPDMLGFGLSDKPIGRDLSLPAQADMLLHFMDHMGLERADIVGHDIGGGVAQLLAFKDTDRVKRLVLIDSVSDDSWPIPEYKALQDAPPSPDRLPPDWVLSTQKPLLARGFYHKKGIDAVIKAYLAPFDGHQGVAAFLRNVDSLDSKYTADIAPFLSRFVRPTLIIWGQDDPFQPLEYAYRLHSSLPSSTLKSFQQAGHYVMEDAPEQVGWAIREFFRHTTEEGTPLPGAPWQEPPHEE